MSIFKINSMFYRRTFKLYNSIITRTCYQHDIKIADVNLSNYLNTLRKEYETSQQSLQTSAKTKHLQPIVELLNERTSILKNLENLKELAADKDEQIRQLADEEHQCYVNQIKDIDERLKIAVLPIEAEDHFPALVLEVFAGVGGQEAMLFASEMFEMYRNFANYKSWQCEIAAYTESEGGGIRHAALLINGTDVNKYLKHEAGVHRVQRIPATEKSGRVHTSTVSVMAVPQPDEIQVHIDPKDLRIETKRATGAGGQHVNTTDSAVRVVHLPTGIAIECQTDRSQHKNKSMAMQRLRAKLYEKQLDEQMRRTEATRRSQVKSNYRNEKIRTYNFNQDRITDHRLGQGHNVHNLKGFMLGNEALEELIAKIDYNRRIEILKSLIEE